LLVLAGCIHETPVLRLRSDATPWPLERPWEGRLTPNRLTALRFEVESQLPGIRFDCRSAAGGVEMSIYSPGIEVVSRGPCQSVPLRQPAMGAWFVVVRADAAADVAVTASANAAGD
jgi:hypothetical protein